MNRIIFIVLLWAGCCQTTLGQTLSLTDSTSAGSASLSVTTGLGNTENPEPVLSNDAPHGLDNNWFILLIIFMILAFGWGIIYTLLHMKDGQKVETDELMRVISMILIVTGALLVPIISVNLTSIPTVAAPLYSLLGTVAGYLLGKGSVAVKNT